MAFTRVAALLHAALSDVTTAQHHTATVAADINLADLAARAHGDLSDSPTDAHHAQAHNLDTHATRAHANLSDSPADAHHNQAHTIASHSDGGAVARIFTGTYTGNDSTSQAITGIGFTVKHVIIWRRQTGTAEADIHWTNDLQVDNNAAGLSYLHRGPSAQASETVSNRIITLGSDGFTVDDGAANQDPNTNTVTYEFTAFG